MKALDTLIKLAEQDVDAERRNLVELEARLNQLYHSRDTVRSAQQQALTIAASGNEELPFWAGIIEGGRRQTSIVSQQIGNQEKVVSAARDALMKRFTELKRLQVISQRRKLAERNHLAALEQSELLERVALHRSGTKLAGE